MATIVNIIIALILGGVRIAGITHVAFQAAAHVYVGGCFGAWFVLKSRDRDRGRFYHAIGWGLSILEVACFAAFKILGADK